MIKKLLALGGLGAASVPGVAVLTVLALSTSTAACLETSMSYGRLAADAPVPADARPWIAATVASCPDLPEAWVAAVMAQESSFDADAYADDANGGTWGLFQLNAAVWAREYGHPWEADLNANGTWDVRDPEVHATVSGRYLCDRLEGVRTIRADHPEWSSSQIPVLDALVIAHNAGESRLATYPDLPAVTARFIQTVDANARAWSSLQPLDGPDAPGGLDPNAPVPARPDPLRPPGTGCLPTLGTATGVTVPPGTPHDVGAAVHTALAYVGVTSGWDGLCDRLACRAYGYANAGHYSAATHWAAMNAQGHARPTDPCPPLGAFVFFRSGAHTYGHVSVVVQASATCDPEQTLVTSNGVFDSATGNHGGVYLLSFARLSAMYLGGRGYLGWSDPICAGTPLPAGTVHPAPSGW